MQFDSPVRTYFAWADISFLIVAARTDEAIIPVMGGILKGVLKFFSFDEEVLCFELHLSRFLWVKVSQINGGVAYVQTALHEMRFIFVQRKDAKEFLDFVVL